MSEYKLNFPIETDKAKSFWESRHKLNRIKSIIAFSLNIENANDNLRRAGYAYNYRIKYLNHYKQYVNNPKMDNVPFSDLEDLWYSPK